MEPITLHTSDAPRVTVCVLSQKDPEMLGRCLASISRNVARETPYELILILNGAAGDVVTFVRRSVTGARVVESAVNLGFGGGNLHAARIAHPDSEFLLLLNDDTVVRPGWLESLLEAADELPRAGAIASRILWPDGKLQEVGSVIWDDGSTAPIGRNLDEDESTRWLFRRQVDYASFCSALVRRSAWDEVDGLDPGYFPAYYEDTDFALTLREAGWEFWVEPASVVTHHESRSTVSVFKQFLFKRNGKRFRERWAHLLPEQVHAEPWLPEAVQAAVDRARGNPRKILVVDDKLPQPALGSGFARSFDVLVELAALPNTAVTIHPTDEWKPNAVPLGRYGIETLPGTKAEFRAHLADPATSYDLVMVSRPHNWEYYAADIRRSQPQARLVYDAEALWHERLHRQADLIPHAGNRANVHRFADEHEALERSIARDADHVVVLKHSDGEFFESEPGHAPVSFVPPLMPDIEPTTAGPETRRHLLFTAGWGSGVDSPNGDGFLWFVREVLPSVVAAQPWVKLLVTGARPPKQLLQMSSPNISFLDHVEDLRSAYDTARVVVAPMRFGAGVKRKTTDALQYGVPTVATTVSAEGIVLKRGDEILIGDDPADFAAHVVRLLTDDDYWSAQREAILALPEFWQSEPGETFASVVERVLADAPPTREEQVLEHV